MATYKGTVAGGDLIMYRGASVVSDELKIIPIGTEIVVSDCNENSNWYHTTYGDASGYVLMPYVINKTAMPKIECYVNSGGLNFRKAPTKSAEPYCQLTRNTIVKVQKHNDTWSSLTYDGKFGFVMTEFLINPDANVALNKGEFYATNVGSDVLKLRRGPGSDYDYIYLLPVNRLMVFEAETSDGTWYKTRCKGAPAYVKASYMQKGESAANDGYLARCLKIAPNEIGQKDASRYDGASGDWCQYFVNWLLQASLMPAERVPTSGGTGWGIAFWSKKTNNGGEFFFVNEAHKARINNESKYDLNVGNTLTYEELQFSPQAGDIIYLRWENEPESVNVNHVGYVVAVSADGKEVHTIEGNTTPMNKTDTGLAVCKKIYYPGSDYYNNVVVGYARPNYNKK